MAKFFRTSFLSVGALKGAITDGALKTASPTISPVGQIFLGDKPLNPYPFWALRFWHGMPFSVWAGLVSEHSFKFSRYRLPLLVWVTLVSVFNSAAVALTNLLYGQQISRCQTRKDPIFIIGHWRSGTTLLHELMNLDQRFCCPTTYQCMAPGHFLLTERFLAPIVNRLLPNRRPMDNVLAGVDRPQEDEFALTNLGAPSPYRRLAFPATASPEPEALDLLTLTVPRRQRWCQLMHRFMRTLSVRDQRRLLLKSPTHTARIAILLEMFPKARFIHVVRDPFVVFPSTIRLWKSLHDTQGLQVDNGNHLEEYVFKSLEVMYRALDRDRRSVPSGSLHMVCYEDLVADPVRALEQVYDLLDLGDFSTVRPLLTDALPKFRDYCKNTYRLDARVHAEILRRWGSIPDFKRYFEGVSSS